jgi:hypothetical protein
VADFILNHPFIEEVVLFKQTPARAIYKIKKNTAWQKVLI